MIEPDVQRLKTYCEQQQKITEASEDYDKRNAYNFVERHITTMQPRKTHLQAWLVAWSADRRVRAFAIRQHGSPTMIADTFETSAAIYEELAARLQGAKKKRVAR